MSEIWLGLMLVALTLAVIGSRRWLARTRRRAAVETDRIQAPLAPTVDNEPREVSLIDDDDQILVTIASVEDFPLDAIEIASDGADFARIGHLAADVLKGAMAVPKRTLEVVFSPEIQRGLKDGSLRLLQTKDGKTLLDAVNSRGHFAGKGFVSHAGRARQLATGAFQLASIAVAQSHLADIEASLGELKRGLAELRARMENEDRSKIAGAIEYLRQAALLMQHLQGPEELSPQRAAEIERVIRDSYAWAHRLEDDLESLRSEMESVKSLDTMGTGNTYRAIVDLVAKLDPLIRRRELLLQLAAATSYVTAWLDPTRKSFTQIRQDPGRWNGTLEAIGRLVKQQSDRFLSKATFNRSRTLVTRSNDVVAQLTTRMRRYGEIFAAHEERMLRHDATMKRLVREDGGLRVALRFDEEGRLARAAVISESPPTGASDGLSAS